MATLEKKNIPDVFMLLPVLAIGVDLFTPYLIWREILPAQMRWISHLAVAAMILLSVLRMFGFNFIPHAFWFIAAVSMLWVYVAVGHGQGMASTIWGVWLLFQFPFVCLFIYLQPTLPQQLAKYVQRFCIIMLGIQVIFQLLQYASGTAPGDDLSGLFGKNGTGSAVLFAILTCSILFGHWIATGRSTGVFIALLFGMISSILGEMKLFALAITLIGLLAVVVYLLKHGAPEKMLVYLMLIFATLVSFISLYNVIIPGANETPIQDYITSPTKLSDYLNRAVGFSKDENLFFDIGRGYAVQLGWESLQRDPITFLFGYGIGTRSESQSLGTAGVALTTGYLGMSVGTSLLVLMQEMGIVGLSVLAGFLLWLILTLAHDIRTYPESPAVSIRYALLLFSVLWPLWLWYATTWTMRAPMLLYWFCLGYVFAEARIARVQKRSQVSAAKMTGG